MDDFIIVKRKYLPFIEEGLNYGEILLFSMIISYYENSQECFVSNEGLVKIFHTSKRNIQIWLKKLKEDKYINYSYENGRRFLVPGEKYFAFGVKDSSSI